MATGGNATSSSLMTVGTDGYTNATTIFRADGYTDFFATSAPFTSNMVGKQIVTWKSASDSSEDSIYNIIAFKDPSNIVINVNNGGTPSSAADGYRPSVTTRSSINYRVIDVATAGSAATEEREEARPRDSRQAWATKEQDVKVIPTIGMIVDYHPLPGTGVVGEDRPAIIVRVWSPGNPESAVQLQVFTDGSNDREEGGTHWRTSVLQGEGAGEFTYRDDSPRFV